jgi:hypothetical protein
LGISCSAELVEDRRGAAFLSTTVVSKMGEAIVTVIVDKRARNGADKAIFMMGGGNCDNERV